MQYDNSEIPKEKKYICFICIQDFKDFHQYQKHIIENHQEGQDYIKCPFCGTPCRDVKSHWIVKHKDRPVPKMEKYRAEKWVNWEVLYMRNKKKKSKWKEGFFDSIKMGKQIHYRSSWERDVMICLEKCINVSEFYGDDHLCIPYMMGGKIHRYWPDFTVKMDNNNIFIIEIKPLDQTEWTINQSKWKFAIEYCAKRQWEFQVWTQKYIRKIKMRSIRNSILLAEHVMPTKEDLLEEQDMK